MGILLINGQVRYPGEWLSRSGFDLEVFDIVDHQLGILSTEGQSIRESNGTHTARGLPRDFGQGTLCTQTLHLKKDVIFFDADEKGDVLLLELPHQRSIGIERIQAQRAFIGGHDLPDLRKEAFDGEFTIVFEVPSWRTIGSTATGKTVFSPGCTQTAPGN